MINYESPVYVSIVLYTIYALLIIATALTVWSVLRGLKLQGKTDGKENGVPARKIAWLTAALVVVTLLVTWLLGSTRPLLINGNAYTDKFWLRISDMFVMTPIVLIGILVIAGIVGAIKKR